MKAHPTHLYILLFNERKLDLLESALQQTRARLEAEGEMDLWHYWDGMRLAAQGQFEAASARAATLPAENKEALERTIAVERARQTGDWPGLADHFEKVWKEKNDAATLLALCEAKLNAGDPRFVVDHAESMLKAVGTPEALRVAATAASRVSAWQFCLQLLDTHVALFPRSQLPADLRRLRIACEQNLGMLSEAERDAEALVSDEKNLENLTLLFHLRVRAGRLPEAVKSAQSILENPEAPAGTLLQIGWLMRLEDRQLSRVALERAVSQGIDDPQQVSAATMLAHELDQHKVLATLVPKMAKLAGAPNSTIQALDFKSTVELLRERAKQTQDTLRLFAAGGMPVHLLAELLRTPLAIWPVLALGNRTHYSPGAVFFRHGGKPGDDVPQRKFDRIYVDLTAFINAHELGLLPLIEQMCQNLVLPRAARMSLVQELDLLSRTQSADDAARGQLLSLVDAGQIASWPSENTPTDAAEWKEGLPAEWCNALEEAGRRSGLLIDYWPKLRDDRTAWVPPAELLPRLSHLGAVLTGLENQGLITSDQMREAMERFAPVSTAAPTNVPTKQQVVILSGGVAKLIAQAQLIGTVAHAFQVLISSDEIVSLRQEEANYQDRSFVAGRVRVILDRLAASSIYHELLLREPITPLNSPNGDAAPYVLAEILQAEEGKDRWVWSDDRWLNGHQHVANLPVISTAEVLTELRKRQLVSDAQYFNLRLRMRSADFRYLPLATDELVHFLNQATTEKNGALVETPELVILRQYWARALAERDTLQFPPIPPGVPNPQGETEFFSGGVRVLHDTFSALFKNLAPDDALGIARATWLLYWMWSPVEHLGAILGKQIDAAAFEKLRGLGEGLFFARLLDANAFGTAAAIQRYGDWLHHYLYDDSSRVADVRRNVERTLEQTAAKIQNGTLEDRAHCAVLNRWYFNLPRWLRDDMRLTAKTRQRLSVGTRSVVGVGDQQFDPQQFWRAAEDTYKGKAAEVVALETKESFGMKLEKKGPAPVLTLLRRTTKEKWGFDDEALGLLDGRESRRLALLLDHPEWFDADRVTVRREAKKIAALHTMQERITALDRLRAKSVWLRYRVIAEKCDERRGPTIDEMSVKDVTGYAGYLRCDEPTAPSIDWEKSARLLLDSVGFPEAFLRLAAIPAPLPQALLAAYDALSGAEKNSFLQATTKALASPLAKAQVFRLQVRQPGSNAVAIGEELLTEAQLAETRALLQVVRWSWTQLGTQASLMSAAMRLAAAWAHAGQIFELLRRISEAADVAKFFSKLDPHVHAEVLVRAPGEDDVAYPRHVNSKVLLMTAVGAAVAAESTAGFQVSETMRKRAEALSKMEGDNVDLPQLEWLYDPAAFTNLLGSFLGAGREHQLRPFVSERVATFVSSGELARQVEALVGAVESDPGHGNSWIMLGSVVRGRSCPEPLKARLGVVMRNTKFEALPATETFRCATILALAAQAAEIGGAELVQIWRTRIAEMAKWLGEMTGNAEEQGQRREMVIRCALTLSRHGPIADPVRCFCDTILAAWRAWPDLEPALIGMLRLLIGLPHHQLASAWSLVLPLRQNAPQQSGLFPVSPESEIMD